MKEYTFHSDLPPEQVRARLMLYGPKLDLLTEHRTSVKFLKDGGFYLVCTEGLPNRPVYPFCGRIESEESGSRIVGGFRMRKGDQVMQICFFGFAWLISIYLFLFGMDPSVELAKKLSAASIWFPGLTIWTGLGFSFFHHAGKNNNQALKQATLRFIEEHLLHS
jgi:hypothetical protein